MEQDGEGCGNEAQDCDEAGGRPGGGGLKLQGVERRECFQLNNLVIAWTLALSSYWVTLPARLYVLTPSSQPHSSSHMRYRPGCCCLDLPTHPPTPLLHAVAPELACK